ncbi:hypothetical protein CEXT_551681 [Caerostris extrusa]|uniref:Uncharacterized protein n=1 Tax=Caerostris extrusa TaxID=172846 RepID=A0AAV4STS0_CAEEX|nr:hypothetical protein CEXT_551681 [Caerostris extrusa]
MYATARDTRNMFWTFSRGTIGEDGYDDEHVADDGGEDDDGQDHRVGHGLQGGHRVVFEGFCRRVVERFHDVLLQEDLHARNVAKVRCDGTVYNANTACGSLAAIKSAKLINYIIRSALVNTEGLFATKISVKIII